MSQEEKFISLNSYIKKNSQILEGDIPLLEDEGIFGNVMDRALSFIPRAARFKKAQGAMIMAAKRYKKRSERLVHRSIKSSTHKITRIIKEYDELMDDTNGKVSLLIQNDDREAATKLLELFLNKIEKLKADNIAELDKSIDRTFNRFDKGIEKKIESPGFVLNVELSEKGKMALGNKWDELVAIANMEIDEFKSINFLKNDDMKKLDEIIAKLQAYINVNRHSGDVEVAINGPQRVSEASNPISVSGEMYANRLKILEKGYIIAYNMDGDVEDIKKNPQDYEKHDYNPTGSGSNMHQKTTTSKWHQKVDEKNKNKYIATYIILKIGKQLIISNWVDIAEALAKQSSNNNKSPFGESSNPVTECPDATKAKPGDICYIQNSQYTNNKLLKLTAEMDQANTGGLVWKIGNDIYNIHGEK